jgi:hypothetical protein
MACVAALPMARQLNLQNGPHVGDAPPSPPSDRSPGSSPAGDRGTIYNIYAYV